jgi:hypothetical protein
VSTTRSATVFGRSIDSTRSLKTTERMPRARRAGRRPRRRACPCPAGTGRTSAVHEVAVVVAVEELHGREPRFWLLDGHRRGTSCRRPAGAQVADLTWSAAALRALGVCTKTSRMTYGRRRRGRTPRLKSPVESTFCV